jgi:FkbM family methyltransferase
MKRVLKYLFSLVPFKKQLFIVIRDIFTPGEKIYQHLYFKDTFKVMVKGDISFLMQHYGYQVENDIFWKGLTGRWEKRSIELWIKLSESSKVVMDIGANTGIYSLISKAVHPAARVIAFEPVERVFKKLKHNFELNQFNVECYSKAVSDHIGQTVFYDTAEEHTYTSTLNSRPVTEGYHPINVEITTIDSIVSELELERLDLIKIDVEYHEPEVMRGFSLISKYHPTILIEILSDDVGKRIQQEIEKYGAQYLYFDINEDGEVRQVETIRKSSGMNYLLCNESIARNLNLI